MSNLYLDIIKDRLYIYPAASSERRSGQTAMYHILDSLVKILTPMTSFTVEEIWDNMKHLKAENVESPMLTDYPEVNKEWDNKEVSEKWEKIINIKNLCAKELEVARAEKTIGNSLDAKITLSGKDDYDFLKENEETLKVVLIVSDLEISKGKKKDLEIKVEHAKGEKCARCWQYSEELEDGICPRCKHILESK